MILSKGWGSATFWRVSTLQKGHKERVKISIWKRSQYLSTKTLSICKAFLIFVLGRNTLRISLLLGILTSRICDVKFFCLWRLFSSSRGWETLNSRHVAPAADACLPLAEVLCGYNFLGPEPRCHLSYGCPFEKPHSVLCVGLLMNIQRFSFCLPTAHCTERVSVGTSPLVWSRFSTTITSWTMVTCCTLPRVRQYLWRCRDGALPKTVSTYNNPLLVSPLKGDCQLWLCSP